MSTSIPSEPAGSQEQSEIPKTNGLADFAGVIMVIVGVWHVIIGITALVNDKIYVTAASSIYSFDLTGWGWIHLLAGILVAGAGVGVLRGQTWGRVVGIVLASLSMVATYLYMPWYPWWSLPIIVLDITIIWALAIYRPEPVE